MAARSIKCEPCAGRSVTTSAIVAVTSSTVVVVAIPVLLFLIPIPPPPLRLFFIRTEGREAEATNRGLPSRCPEKPTDQPASGDDKQEYIHDKRSRPGPFGAPGLPPWCGRWPSQIKNAYGAMVLTLNAVIQFPRDHRARSSNNTESRSMAPFPHQCTPEANFPQSSK